MGDGTPKIEYAQDRSLEFAVVSVFSSCLPAKPVCTHILKNMWADRGEEQEGWR